MTTKQNPGKFRKVCTNETTCLFFNIYNVVIRVFSASELRHRRRVERKQKMVTQVRDMKRRQQANEHWQQRKRSLYVPWAVGGAVLIGGALVAYLYFKTA